MTTTSRQRKTTTVRRMAAAANSVGAARAPWLALSFFAAMPVAAELQALDTEFLSNAGYFEAGPVRIYPALTTAVGYDDNIFESAEREVDSIVTRVIPEISAVLPVNTGYFQLGAQADDWRYSDSSDDDFTEATAYGRAAVEANSRNRFNFDARYIKARDPRGTFLTEGFDPALSTINGPDEYTDERAAIKYEYGAAGAKGRLRLGADYLDHSYDNHRDRTRFFDREEYGASGTFLYRVGGRTALALEGRERRIEYKQQDPTEPGLDSRQRSLMLGAEIDPVGATSGSLRVGRLRKNFEDSARVDGTNTVWELSAKWRPRSYSTFEITVERLPNETNGNGDFVDTRSERIDWTHKWTDRIGTLLAVSHMRRSYQNADRESRSKMGSAGISYQMRRWLKLRLDGSWRTRSSNVDALEFERSRYWVTAEFTL